MKIFQIANLRLGFGKIPPSDFEDIRVYSKFLLNNPIGFPKPEFIKDENQVFIIRKSRKALSNTEKKQLQKENISRYRKLKLWWLDKIYNTSNPLQEKMVLFWHNHFVSSYQKVKGPTFIYNQNELFRRYAFGNFKDLTKKILYDNAMIVYLDNKQNIAKSPNENLSRELLELFTLGINNYSELDIKEGARALAGLRENINGGRYNSKFEDNGIKSYLGKKGNLKADDLAEAIFNHPKAPFKITEKLLKFFITDDPDNNLIEEYGQFLVSQNFEIKPFLLKLFTETDFLKYNGAKIKSPLEFLFNSYAQFSFSKIPSRETLTFLKNQGMEILNPPNVKGWSGGHAWLDSGKLIERNAVIDRMLNNRFIEKSQRKGANSENSEHEMEDENLKSEDFIPMISVNLSGKSRDEVVKEISDQLIFYVDEDIKSSMENIIGDDFNPDNPDAKEYLMQLMRYLMKSPQYQIL